MKPKSVFFSIVGLFFCSTRFCRSGEDPTFDITQWTKTSSLQETSYAYVGHVFGNGRFFVRSTDSAYGYYPTLTSADGITWETNQIAAYLMNPVRFEGGLFVGSGGACGGTPEGGPNAAYTCFGSSSDGANWSWDIKNNFSCGASPVAYGNGKFLSIAYGGNVMTSLDGKTWSDSGKKFPTPDDLYIFRDLRFGNGRFVALYQPFLKETISMISTDCFTWAAGGTNSAKFGDGFYFGNGVFITANKKFSHDGLTWKNFELDGQITDIAVGAGRFFALLLDGRIAISFDGVNWQVQPGTAQPADPNISPRAFTIAYGNGRLVTGLQQLLTSPELCFLSVGSGSNATTLPITIFGVPGKTYQIESRDAEDVSGGWKSVGSVIAEVDGSATIPLPTPMSQTVFRARTD